ncbi:hypothetical protein EPJ67_03805 [Brachyspira aalborgi]|uniref:Lipocalin-like domain-containing protein n=1 Tax=Brachyspira aalborgi TaxID=29522 RepID=A0A5C8G7B8_9SPIR|nr:hypothetical protein [Brachyspira aalborgi]TXJ57786.1 hypothetical protein EPJ67_03805 [Brachyspira aalborgi]
MNNKKIIITILSFIILFAISCKSNEDPAQFKPSDLIGTWFGGGNSFTIDSSRNLNFDYQGVNYQNNAFKHIIDEPTQYLSTTAYSDINYSDTSKYNIGHTIKVARFSFNSSSSCDVYIGEIKLIEEYSELNGKTITNKSWDYSGAENTSLGTFTK